MTATRMSDSYSIVSLDSGRTVERFMRPDVATARPGELIHDLGSR